MSATTVGTPRSLEAVASADQTWCGVLKEFPAFGSYGAGLIEMQAEGAESTISFNVRELENGGEELLKVGARVAFSKENGRAINLRLLDVKTYSGIIREYKDRIGIIIDDVSSRHIQMKFDGIFKKLPEKITPGLRVTYTLAENEVTAANIRFPDVQPSSGEIVRFFNDKFGEIQPHQCDKKIKFHIAALRYQDQPDSGHMRPGSQVTYELERKFSRSAGKNKASQIAATNVALQDPSLVAVIQPVEHIEAGAIVPAERLGFGTNAESSNVDAITPSTCSDDKLVRLRFSRNPKEFHEVLQMLDAPGASPDNRLSCGAYIFAPADFHAAIEGKSQELQLDGADVIVTAELEHFVMNEVNRLPRKYKITVTPTSVYLHGEEVVANEIQEDKAMSEDTIRIEVKRTFIHVELPSSLYSKPSGGPRTASTTDLPGRAINPRCSGPRSSREAQPL